MCLRFVLMTALWDVKLHSKREMKTVIEGAFIQEKKMLQRRDRQNLNFRKPRSEFPAWTHRSSRTQSRRAIRSRLNFRSDPRFPQAERAFQQQTVPVKANAEPLGHEGCLTRWAAVHASRCLAKSRTGSFLCSSHNLIIQSLLEGNETS